MIDLQISQHMPKQLEYLSKKARKHEALMLIYWDKDYLDLYEVSKQKNTVWIMILMSQSYLISSLMMLLE